MRRLTAWGALLALAAALNALVWLQRPFALAVLVPLAAAAGLASTWLTTVFAGPARGAAGMGRAAGGVNTVLSSAVFLGIVAVLYAFFVRWDAAYDLTQEGRRDLAPQTVQVLETLNRDVQVVCFFLNIDDELVQIGRDKTVRFLDQCRRHTNRLQIEMLDPHIDRTRLEALNITHASAQGTVVIKAGERQRAITLGGGSPRLEERDFTNALVNVLRQTEPKVYFLAGHNERDIASEDERTGGSMFRNLLTGAAYAVDTLQIRSSDPEVPQDCDVLVINNPAGDLLPQEEKALQAYLDRGGRLLLLIDPWRSVQQGLLGREVLRPWLETRYGVRIGSDIVVDDTLENKWLAEISGDPKPFEGVEADFGVFRGGFNAQHPVTANIEQTLLFQANRTVSPVEKLPAGVMVAPLLRTAPGFWAEGDVNTLAETGQAVRNESEPKGPLYLAAAVVARTNYDPDRSGRPREARIVVVGDSDFAANGQLTAPGNLDFLLRTVAWLGEYEDLVAIRPSAKNDPPLILTDTQRRAVAWLAIMLPTQAVAALGIAVMLLRRRNA